MEAPEAGDHGNVYTRTEAPRLEDAGLENPALSPGSIQRAFQLAAERLASAAPGALGMPVEPPAAEDGSPPGGAGTEGGLGEEPGCVGDPRPSDAPAPDGQAGGPPAGEGGEEAHLGEPGGDSCVDTKTGGLVEEGSDALVGGPRPEEEGAMGEAGTGLDGAVEGRETESVPQLGGSGKGCVKIGISGLGDIPGKLGIHIGGTAPGLAL